MCDLKIEAVRISAVKAVRLVVAVRNMLRPLGLEFSEVVDLEREFRAAAGELQRAEKSVQEGG